MISPLVVESSVLSVLVNASRISPLTEDSSIFSALTSGKKTSPLVVDTWNVPVCASGIWDRTLPLTVFTLTCSRFSVSSAGR